MLAGQPTFRVPNETRSSRGPRGNPSERAILASCPGWAAAWFLILVVVTLAVRIADPTGWLGSDDAAYFSAAEHVLEGRTITRVHHQYARMAVVLPVALSMSLFGESPTAVALPMLVASTLCVIAVALLGRLLWGWWEGLFAAGVVSVLPYFRVLSTTAFPDVHVCLWATVTVLCATAAVRSTSLRRSVILLGISGLALGLAISAKVFAVWTAVAIVVVVWTASDHGWSRRRKVTALAWIVSGCTLLFLFDGFFYLWAAGDFFFNLHAIQQAQAEAEPALLAVGSVASGFAEVAWDRLTMLLHPTISGWGWIGVLFWPVTAAACVFSRKGRSLAAWAIITYLAVALMPISLKQGSKPFPSFHGRHILPACVPFALCLAWFARRSLDTFARPVIVHRCWPIALATVVALGFVNRRELSGFRDRPTGRVGVAVSRLAESIPSDGTSNIFMSPSTYWRYRLLFPAELRSRLRVAVDAEAPTWWRDTTVDITARAAPLPLPDSAYLLATPRQLSGETENWDYGVGLPRWQLNPWGRARIIAQVSGLPDNTIGGTSPGAAGAEPILLLLGRESTIPSLATTATQR